VSIFASVGQELFAFTDVLSIVNFLKSSKGIAALISHFRQ